MTFAGVTGARNCSGVITFLDRGVLDNDCPTALATTFALLDGFATKTLSFVKTLPSVMECLADPMGQAQERCEGQG